jgi:hypothetical protein
MGEITMTDAYALLRAWRSCRYRRLLSPWCRAKGPPASTQRLTSVTGMRYGRRSLRPSKPRNLAAARARSTLVGLSQTRWNTT